MMDYLKGASAVVLAIIVVTLGLAFIALIFVVSFFLRIILSIALAGGIVYLIIRGYMESQKK